MRAAIFHEPGSVTAGERPDAALRESTDAVVRVVLACVCGSDLWFYRGESPFEPGPIGHEFIGVVEDVGDEVTAVERGDLVIAPFAYSDGTCPHCRHGITTSCANGGFFPMNGDGGQGEAVRVPLADGTLVKVPGSGHSEVMLRSLLTLSDVMSTGHHAAVCAEVKRGDTVAVVGDGAVGLCGVLAARRLGAERVIVLGRSDPRWKAAYLRRRVARHRARRGGGSGCGARADRRPGRGRVLECVGTREAFDRQCGSQPTCPTSSTYPTNATVSISAWASSSGATRPQRR